MSYCQYNEESNEWTWLDGLYCSKCGAQLEFSYSYCPHCGTVLSKEFNYPTEETNYNYKCPDCKGEFSYPTYKYDGAFYETCCPFCGRKMII